MKILLDTTYILPTIGIAVKELPRDAIIRAMEKENQVVISQISLFELAAKGAKYVKNGALEPETVTKGIRAIVYDNEIEIVPIEGTRILLTAFALRKMLDDFIDCLILSTAINNCDALLTEDTEIQNLRDDTQFSEVVKAANPNFRVTTLSGLLATKKRNP
jgi:PIN domain nuclease of toxin-antitoxin system